MNARLVTDNAQDEVLLAHALRSAGMKIGLSHTLAELVESWREDPADFLLVALRTPDPVPLARELRRAINAPLVMVVERLTEDTHVDLIETGVDWVIERPYSLRLLMAYSKAILRRGGNASRESMLILRYDEVRLNPANRTVTVDSGPIQRLSQLECRLLHTLMIHQGQVLPTELIVEHVWGYTGEGDRSLVRGLVNRLRMKIEPDPNNPRYIRTLPRVGYLFGDNDH